MSKFVYQRASNKQSPALEAPPGASQTANLSTTVPSIFLFISIPKPKRQNSEQKYAQSSLLGLFQAVINPVAGSSPAQVSSATFVDF